MAAKLLSEMEVVEESPTSSCAGKEKEGGTRLTFHKLGPTFTLMGQAQNGYSTQVLVRKVEETWMSLSFNSLGQAHLSERKDQGLEEGVIGLTHFSACGTHPFKIESAWQSLTIFLSQSPFSHFIVGSNSGLQSLLSKSEEKQGCKIDHLPGRV